MGQSNADFTLLNSVGQMFIDAQINSKWRLDRETNSLDRERVLKEVFGNNNAIHRQSEDALNRVLDEGLESLIETTQKVWNDLAFEGDIASNQEDEFEQELREEALDEKVEIIVLCGSTRFIKLFDEMSLKFTLQGKIVLSVGTHYTSDHGAVWEDKKPMLDELHKRKIDLADRVFIINKDKYIGDSTRSEILYAVRNHKVIEYLEE